VSSALQISVTITKMKLKSLIEHLQMCDPDVDLIINMYQDNNQLIIENNIDGRISIPLKTVGQWRASD
jgi:hypothetical protein